MRAYNCSVFDIPFYIKSFCNTYRTYLVADIKKLVVLYCSVFHLIDLLQKSFCCLTNLYYVLQLREYLEENVELCRPKRVHICDGSETENERLTRLMVSTGTLKPLTKYKNWWVWCPSLRRYWIFLETYSGKFIDLLS